MSVTIQSPTIIIGAGPAGLAAAAALRHEGLPYLHYDAHTDIGGSWHPEHPHRYLPSHRLQSGHLGGFNNPSLAADVPAQPTRDQVYAHIQHYAQHHDVGAAVLHRHEVTDLHRTSTGWVLTGLRHHHDAAPVAFSAMAQQVIIAVGHRTEPVIPSWCPSFTARTADQLPHAHKAPLLIAHTDALTSANDLAGHRVAFVGVQDATVDAVALAFDQAINGQIAADPWPWLVPDLMGTRTYYDWLRVASYLPHVLREHAQKLAVTRKMTAAKTASVPDAKTPLLSSTPVLASRLIPHLASRKLTVGPRVTGIDGAIVHSTDSQLDDITAVVLGTGHVHTPTLLRTLLPHQLRMHLFADTFAQNQPGLFVVGHHAVADGSFRHYEASAQMIAHYVAALTQKTRRAALLRDLINGRTSLPVTQTASGTPWLFDTARDCAAAMSDYLNADLLAPIG